jgi:hypothetical protein
LAGHLPGHFFAKIRTTLCKKTFSSYADVQISRAESAGPQFCPAFVLHWRNFEWLRFLAIRI